MDKTEKIEIYELVNLQLRSLLSAQNYTISNLSNAAALLWNALPDQVFTGFYLLNKKQNQLILAPFQGSVSCVEIALGKGVCGQAAQELKTLVVPDVTQWQNYISCDSAARSEIVLPLVKDGQLVGVLDLDSTQIGFYDEVDAKYLAEFAEILCQLTDFKFFEVI